MESSEVSSVSHVSEDLIHVSVSHILLSMAPLYIIAYISWLMELKLENSIFIGTIRSFVQLTILGLILETIFVRGEEMWELVLAYIAFMFLVSSYESSTRTKYHFVGMYYCILFSLAVNVTTVSLLTFGILLKLDPLWDPQYVIPMVGMILGNCINGISLSLSTILTSLVEEQREIELYLSFGGTSFESTTRLVREAVSIGSTPQLNSMAVIGLVSIPGMMTGQILGGAPVTEAARYQMLIIYLNAISTFGTVLAEVYIALYAGFGTSASSHILRLDRFKKRSKNKFNLSTLWNRIVGCCCCLRTSTGTNAEHNQLVQNNNRENQTSTTRHGEATPLLQIEEGNTKSYQGDALPTRRRKIEISKLSLPSSSSSNTAKDNGRAPGKTLLEVQNLMHSVALLNDDANNNVNNDLNNSDNNNNNHNINDNGNDNDDAPDEQDEATTSTSPLSTSASTSATIATMTSAAQRDAKQEQDQNKNQKQKRRILFQDLSFTVRTGEIIFIKGPTGTGKSTILRILAGLTPIQKGALFYHYYDHNHSKQTNSKNNPETNDKYIYRRTGHIAPDDNNDSHTDNNCHMMEMLDMTIWRQHIRYVTQFKVDIPGTPNEFLAKVQNFKVSKHNYDHRNGTRERIEQSSSSSISNQNNDIRRKILGILKDWGFPNHTHHGNTQFQNNASNGDYNHNSHANNSEATYSSPCLDTEWKLLSGGEAQRIILALALVVGNGNSPAPKVILLDEITSSLDNQTKLCVEETILNYVRNYHMSVIWITHDQDQIERITKRMQC